MESSKLFFQALIAKSGKHLFGFHSPSTYYQVPNNQGGRNEQGVGKIPKFDKRGSQNKRKINGAGI